jgi:hypothetical protein
MPHLPLSNWVARIALTGDAPIRWNPRCGLNDGDERADARRMYGDGDRWERRALPLDLGYSALALVHEDATQALVELDEMARPIPASADGAQVISDLEDGWPAGDATPEQRRVLERQDVSVRSLLLARLAADGNPAPEMFGILPWDRLERLAEETIEGLREPPTTEMIMLRDWFNAVGPRFTAALEQLDQGLRDADPELTRVGGTTLCTRLAELNPLRLPDSTRAVLIRLVGELAFDNEFLRPAVERVRERLLVRDAQGPALRMPSEVLAASGEDEIRRVFTETIRDPFLLTLGVSNIGRVTFDTLTPLRQSRGTWLTRAYGVMLLPVLILGEQGATRYYVALEHEDDTLSGSLDLPGPPGNSVAVDLGGPPIGRAEARFLDADEVERSVIAHPLRSARAVWRRLTDDLPSWHPVRTVVERVAE